MKEDQHTEWKASWRDDLLKWVCGFANTDGGVPGIMVDVNLLTEQGHDLLEIQDAGDDQAEVPEGLHQLRRPATG